MTTPDRKQPSNGTAKLNISILINQQNSTQKLDILHKLSGKVRRRWELLSQLAKKVNNEFLKEIIHLLWQLSQYSKEYILFNIQYLGICCQ